MNKKPEKIHENLVYIKVNFKFLFHMLIKHTNFSCKNNKIKDNFAY